MPPDPSSSPVLDLFQYWDAAPPPADVAPLIDTWRAEPGFRHRLFGREEAAALMEEVAGARGLAAFRRCAYAAMESDLFRLAAILAHGGAYVDADIASKGGLKSFLRPGSRGFILGHGEGVPANGVILAARPGDPLVAAALDLAVGNVERRASNVVSEVTGPAVFQRLLGDPATRPLWEGFQIVQRPKLKAALRFVQPSYKRSLADWRVAAYYPEQFSIYRDD